MNELLADTEFRRTYEEELLFGETTDTIAGLLKSLGITQRELARRLELSEGRISQVLSGSENLTLRTLASVGWAVGVRFNLEPIAFPNRLGTPAAEDPPLPRWLFELPREPAIHVSQITLPSPEHLQMTHPGLRFVDGAPADSEAA